MPGVCPLCGSSALVDLSWPEFLVVVEYEGDPHRDKDRFRRDIHRLERLADHQWLVVRVSADDLLLRPEETVSRMRVAFGGEAGRDPCDCGEWRTSGGEPARLPQREQQSPG